MYSTVVGILWVTEHLWDWRQLSGESHKEGDFTKQVHLWQEVVWLLRRELVACVYIFYHMQQYHILGFQSLYPRNTEIPHR